jgi:HD-like signal output (HDOD) protein
MGKVVVLDKSAFRKRIERISSLPTLPSLLQKCNEMTKDPKISMDILGKELSKDQVITSRLLKMINSAYYGFPSRIRTIKNKDHYPCTCFAGL